ncbi:LCP family protein [Gordonia otitidis]|nr:LCP family protein [Gordonia otitidis]
MSRARAHRDPPGHGAPGRRQFRGSDGRRLTAGEVAARSRRRDSASEGMPPQSFPAQSRTGRWGVADDLTQPIPAVTDAPDIPRRTVRRGRATPPRGRSSLFRIGRVAVALCSVAILGVVGLAWGTATHVAGGFGRSGALAGGPASAGGAENILLMGLDTRKDRDGNNLPPDILKQLHAGDGDEGGYNTNTLILVHIPADKKNIVAFSIPRDDLVDVDGLDVSQAKIKEAYGRKKAMVEDQLTNQGVTDQATLESRGREAGRAETIQTVRQLTGVPIDRFAEVSLVGFYDIAKALGGIDVCLNHSVRDSYSGARFPAGRQHLNASQSLAFVRQRHGLDNGDLDRTHRQQAFLLSVTHQLQSTGMLTDPGKLNRLTSALNNDVVLSDGWDLMSWGQQMLAPSDQRISFRTLPVERYDTVDGQDVNIIDVAKVRAQIQTAFGMQAPSSSSRPSGSTDTQDVPSGASADAAGATSTSAAPSDPAEDETTASLDGPAPDSGDAVNSGADIPCVD